MTLQFLWTLYRVSEWSTAIPLHDHIEMNLDIGLSLMRWKGSGGVGNKQRHFKIFTYILKINKHIKIKIITMFLNMSFDTLIIIEFI